MVAVKPQPVATQGSRRKAEQKRCLAPALGPPLILRGLLAGGKEEGRGGEEKTAGPLTRARGARVPRGLPASAEIETASIRANTTTRACTWCLASKQKRPGPQAFLPFVHAPHHMGSLSPHLDRPSQEEARLQRARPEIKVRGAAPGLS